MSSKQPSGLSTIQLKVSYPVEQERCSRFLEKFVVSKEDGIQHKYMDRLVKQEISDLKRKSVDIELDDILSFDDDGEEFVENIQSNAQRYIELFSRAIDSLLPETAVQLTSADTDVVSVIVAHRVSRQKAKNLDDDPKNLFPPALLRKYSVNLIPLSKTKSQAVRQVSARQIGSLINVRGIVTRVSEVKPLVVVGAYTCDKCGYEIYQEVTSESFTPLPDCPSEQCTKNNSKGQLFMQTRGSKFLKFQEVKLQELADQVPIGHIPRSMTVKLYEDMARTCNPGDHVVISGIFLPVPYTGFKGLRAGLLTDTFLSATKVHQIKQKYDDFVLTEDISEKINSLSQNPEIYKVLAKSIAPEIFGHDDVKKALVLLMVGGVTKEMEDGMKIRGDLNICLMGDPGVAKSQLLKFITKIAPRGVYTTGKGSSGVGLTAAVNRDPITNEMVLEGGALVLADNGICCIDEFDKMDESDRTAIHEVMEQQTISISKAGISTTLNARTSILAAANPLHGRYNVKKSPKDNINLPYALLSRFDILFLILDKANLDEDTRLAQHIAHVHRFGKPVASEDETLSPEVIRQYIARAKQFAPVVPKQLADYIVGAYVSLRMNDESGKDTYTTPRTLLAILRLSQALAKIRFDNLVSKEDVDEAMRLFDSSRASIYLSNQKGEKNVDPISRIYTLILELPGIEGTGEIREIPMESIREKVKSRGFNEIQLQQCIEEFDKCNIWTMTQDGTRLRIIN